MWYIDSLKKICKKYHGILIFTFISKFNEQKLKIVGFNGRRKISKFSWLGHPTKYVYEFTVFSSETPCEYIYFLILSTLMNKIYNYANTL